LTLLYHYSNPVFKGKPWAIEEGRKKKKKHKPARIKISNQQFRDLVKRTQDYLVPFWDRFNSAETDEARLSLLRAYSVPPWKRVSQHVRRLCRKDPHHQVSALFDSLGLVKCATCDDPAENKHHIVPCCFGGPTISVNLILICEKCHESIHPWMAQ